MSTYQERMAAWRRIEQRWEDAAAAEGDLVEVLAKALGKLLDWTENSPEDECSFCGSLNDEPCQEVCPTREAYDALALYREGKVRDGE